MLLEAQITNITISPISIEHVLFDPIGSAFTSTDLNSPLDFISVAKDSKSISTKSATLDPLDTRQYLFKLIPSPTSTNPVSSLGKVSRFQLNP
jgi:hypothetical protein